MNITNLTSDEATLEAFGRKMADARLARQLTQAQLAKAAGVSKRTVERLEDGASIQFTNLIRCLRALEKLDGLERLLPDTPPNPIALLERHGKVRQRARPETEALSAEPWTWDDDA